MADRRWLAPMLVALVVLVAAMVLMSLTESEWAQWFGFVALVGFVAFFTLTRHGVTWALVMLGMVFTAVVAGVLID